MTRSWPMIVALLLPTGFPLAAEEPPSRPALPSSAGYVITDLGSLGGGQTVPTAIDVRGDVAGYSTTATGQVHAFLLPAGGAMQDLGALGGAASYATSLNNRGDVAGYLTTASGQTHAFAVLDGQMMDLGANGGGASRAAAINDLRQVLVVSTDSQGNTTSLLWQAGQTATLSAATGTFTAAGLNNLGQVVGTIPAVDGSNHAFAYDSFLRQLLDMGDIGPGGVVAHVSEIGLAVGTRIRARGTRVAFGADLRQTGSSVASLWVSEGLNGTNGFGINNEGTAVGLGEISGPAGTSAGAWPLGGEFLNLNDLALPSSSGWVLLSATAINDAGVIVGKALSPTGQPVAYMLTVPGPALPAEKASAIATSLGPVLDLLRIGADAAASAATPTPLATTLTDLQQARSFLTPPAGQDAASPVNAGQASHLLNSGIALLMSVPGSSPFLAPTDRDRVIALLTTAQSGLQ
jgi:probable HAF family extracellular repeat protein